MVESSFSLAHLVETDARYIKLKERLKGPEIGTDEYIRKLMHECPLNSYPDYGEFLEKQDVTLEGTQEKGYSAIHRSVLSPDHLVTCLDDSILTMYDHFMFSVRNWPKNECLGVRPYDPATKTWEERYEFQTYEQVSERIHNMGSGLMSLVNAKRNKPLNSNDFIVAILSHNTQEWVMSDLACQAYGLTNTSLYESLGPETSEYIMELTESPVLIFSNNNMFKIINMLPKMKYINTLVCMDDIDNKDLKLLNDAVLTLKENCVGEKISLYSLDQVEHVGRLNRVPVISSTPEDAYTISFTSGTTGIPKGVVVSQRQVTSGIALVFALSKIPSHKREKQLRYLCFLPLAHIFQRVITLFSLSRGVGIGFLHKPDPLVLVEDMKVLKADFAALVPRVLTRFEAGIKNSLEKTSFQKRLTSAFLEAKKNKIYSKNGRDRSLLNALIIRRVLTEKVRDSLGFNNCDFIIVGSAPISPETLVYLRSTLDLGVRQGYGLTETLAGICVSEPFEKDPGTCGAIGCAVECRLKSVPEMGYNAEDSKGELQVRGPQVFESYFKRPDETEKVIDSNGWFSTGDIASIDSIGRLIIIDRVKNFFKLSQGEYVAPEKVESMYSSSCPHITQIFVYGDSLKSYLVGVVGIDVLRTKKSLGSKHPEIKHLSDERFVEAMNTSQNLRKDFLSVINRHTKHLQGFEKLKNVHVGIEPLKLEDDTMTPTLKIKRANATRHFRQILDALYEEGSLIKMGKL